MEKCGRPEDRRAKKLCVILILLLIATITAGCGNNAQSSKMDKQVMPKLPVLQDNTGIKIITDVKKYSPLMSSVQGIGIKPEFKTNLKESEVQYHWTSTGGDFVLLGNKRVKEVRNSGQRLLWIPDLQESSGQSAHNAETANITITLKAEDPKTGRIWAETSLTIEQDGVFYIVKP